jgi:transcriptional regulator with XRE-family HTH domain
MDPAWGAVLRSRRLAMELTLRDVQRLSGVTYAYISEIELGRNNASYGILTALCEALGMGVAEYLRLVAYVMEHPNESGTHSLGVGERAEREV